MFVRDPVWGLIEISDKEKKVIDSPLFQRLRNIKQLSLSYLVYPSANHTRFEHSIGTMQVAKQMAKNFGENEEEFALSGLLHDIGHVAFSHDGEKVLEYFGFRNHEELGIELLQESEICWVLDYVDLEHPAISSSIGADRIDYLLRDSYHVGVAYGIVEHDILIKNMVYDKRRICVKNKSLEALESFFIARFMMHMAVYLHKTIRIASSMLVKALDAAKDHLSLDDLIKGDFYVMHRLLNIKRSKKIAENIVNRKLAKLLARLPSTKDNLEIAKEMEKSGCFVSYPFEISTKEDVCICNGNCRKRSTAFIKALEKAEKEKNSIIIACERSNFGKALKYLNSLIKS